MARSSLAATRRAGWGAAVQDTLVIVLATLLTALAALLIEDMLPNSDQARVVGARIAVTLTVLTALALVIVGRLRRRRTRGTLYYVRYLAEWMNDNHLDEYQGSRAGHLDSRVVTGWMTTGPDEAGLVDVADDLRDLGARLQATMNEDNVSTAFNLAPNLLWPMAMALGYDLYLWPETLLEEARPRDTNLPRLTWRVDDLPGWSLEPDPVVSRASGTSPSATSAFVTVRLSNDPQMVRVDLPVGQRYDVAVPLDSSRVSDGPGDARAVLVQRERPKPHEIEFDARDGRPAYVYPVAAMRITLAVIREALHDNPDSPVLLLTRAPKTVNLAVGWGLANPQSAAEPGLAWECPDRHESCRHPWRRLIPLLLDQTTGQQPNACRVHRAQPCLPVLHQRLQMGRIDPDEERHMHRGCDCPEGRRYAV